MLSSTMRYSAVLFDLDGTLLNTLVDIATAANRTLADHGLPTHPPDRYRDFVGSGVVQLITRALPESHRNAKIIERCLEEYRRHYARTWNDNTRPYDGIPEMLDGVVARGIRMAILSNKPDEYTQQCVNEQLPRWSFDVVLGASHDYPHKPDPASALAITARMNIPPAQFLYLGDTSIDVYTAIAAGMTPVGALWGFRPRQELVQAGATVFITRPEELLNLL